MKECAGRKVSFDFTHTVDGVAYPSALSDGEQEKFRRAFCTEVGEVERWFRKRNWLNGDAKEPPPLGSHVGCGIFGLPGTDLSVSVSNEFSLARSLIPAALGRRGRMEFPAYRVTASQANIAHELTHVYFPNGNRLLAEGLAVYVQYAIGGNDAFPNFGDDLRQLTRDMISDRGHRLSDISLTQLDSTSTPDSLRLRIGTKWYESYESYVVAGSFIQFLLEGLTPERKQERLEKFYTLYSQTPLRPMGRNRGPANRWQAIYGRPLTKLQSLWAAWL